MPDEQLYEELSVLAEELGQLHADLLAQTDVDVDRLRAVRSRLVDLAEKRRRERRRVSHQTRKWLDAVLKVIDGLIRLLEERQRVNEEVRAAVARLGQVASGPPDLSPSPARRRFWDVGA